MRRPTVTETLRSTTCRRAITCWAPTSPMLRGRVPQFSSIVSSCRKRMGSCGSGPSIWVCSRCRTLKGPERQRSESSAEGSLAAEIKNALIGFAMNDKFNKHQPRPAASRQAVNSKCGVTASVAMLITVLALSTVHADDGKSGPTSPNPKAATAPEPSATFDLRIVGPDGKSVPEAKIELRTTPVIQSAQIHRGKY